MGRQTLDGVLLEVWVGVVERSQRGVSWTGQDMNEVGSGRGHSISAVRAV